MPEQPLTYESFAQEVREYIRDFPELNRLISGVETSPRMVQYCIHLAVDEYNTTPPLTPPHGIANFPSRSILLQLTIIHILTSVGILHSRNRFTYSDGGYTVETEQQEGLYQRWIQLIRSQLAPRLQQLKVAKNIEGGWGGGVGSEYGWIHGWYGLG